MQRLIDADETKKAIIKRLGIKDEHCLLPAERAIVEVIESMPTVDAEPVRHGRWTTSALERNSSGVKPYYLFCSECNHSQWRTSKYCPDCGAKMDGEEE